MTRLPSVGGDNNQWGQILNDFLGVSHNADGTLKNTGTFIANGTSPQTASLSITGNSTIGGALTTAGHSAFGSAAQIDEGDAAASFTIVQIDDEINITTQEQAYALNANIGTTLTADASNTGLIGSHSTATVGGGAHNLAYVYGGLQAANIENAVSSGLVVGSYLATNHLGTGTLNEAYGAQTGVYSYSSGQVDAAYGLYTTIDNYDNGMITSPFAIYGAVQNQAAGTMTTARAAYFRVTNIAAGSIGTAYGVQIGSAINSGGGTVANNYGLYINNQASVGSTNSYNFYSAGTSAKNYIDGKLQIGSTQTSARLHIGANTDTTAAGGILFGTDTNLYRSAANTLMTDDMFVSAGYTLTDATNIVVGTTTGTKIGTATTQKLGFWNATPVVRPATGGAAATFVANSSAIANDTATFDGYTIGQVVRALRNVGILT